MNIDTLKNEYPNLFKKVPEDINELRYLLVIDENYHDEDSDELDDFNPSDYNYLLYATEIFQELLGEKGMVELVKRLNESESFEDFYPSEIDLYGIKTDLDKEGIAKTVLSTAEEIIS